MARYKNWGNKTYMNKGIRNFKPDRSYIKSAVENYLKSGGQITKIKATADNFEMFMRLPTPFNETFM